MKNTSKIMAVGFALSLAASFSSFATSDNMSALSSGSIRQASNYGFPQATTCAGSAATNFNIVVITSTTNIVTLWSNAISAFASYTNTVSVTNSLNSTQVDCRGQDHVPIFVGVIVNGSSTANTVVKWQVSQDGTKWGNDTLYTWAQTGTTESYLFTNAPTYGFPVGRLQWLTNAAASASITNIDVQLRTLAPIIGALGH